MERMKRKEEEFLCRGHILNALSSPIYTTHQITLPVEFLVGVIIACLPKSWNGYKKKLKHDE
ncbi:hypothetical protein BVC80_8795g15 [Macleaya cordata]|uniref:Uncharacterized protein n=1 Tax=Macleaya cordata TaxID=56857 RepID=A0A200PVC7_MACCD|nr:hypothetical protein BVC80_8795g15 [Macleaya cordata]